MEIEELYIPFTMEGNNLIVKNWLQQKKFLMTILYSSQKTTRYLVHDLRVAVKKMRSYLRLKQELLVEEWKESFSKYRHYSNHSEG
jgi:hypothetical protein